MGKPTRPSVINAIREFSKIKREAFLEKYSGGHAAVNWFILYGNGRYDLKAIWAAAHTPVVRPSSFNTSEPWHAVTKLGFELAEGKRDARPQKKVTLQQLRARAYRNRQSTAQKIPKMIVAPARSSGVHRYVLARAGGKCEGCDKPAPFKTAKGKPYLEPHHTIRLADNGPDSPECVIALCPTCHSRVHHAHDSGKFNKRLIAVAKKIEDQQAVGQINVT